MLPADENVAFAGVVEDEGGDGAGVVGVDVEVVLNGWGQGRRRVVGLFRRGGLLFRLDDMSRISFLSSS